MQFCKSQVTQPNRLIWFALTRPRDKPKTVPVRNLCRLENAPFPTSIPRDLSTGRALATTSRCGHRSEDGHGVAWRVVVLSSVLRFQTCRSAEAYGRSGPGIGGALERCRVDGLRRD